MEAYLFFSPISRYNIVVEALLNVEAIVEPLSLFVEALSMTVEALSLAIEALALADIKP